MEDRVPTRTPFPPRPRAWTELTDRIIHRFFAMPAPGFLVLSATMLLPLERFPDSRQSWLARSRELRDLKYKPERFLPPERETDWASLVRQKRKWIDVVGATHAERLERFERIRAINAALSPLVQPLVDGVQAAQSEMRQRIELNEIARRRDYAFCLYPEEMLRTFFS